MVIHLKDGEVDALVRELAHSRGIGITTAIREAAAEALEADRARGEGQDHRPLEQRLKPLLDRRSRSGQPAKLNLGDCVFYAAAKAAGARLLHKGDDFVHTDLA